MARLGMRNFKTALSVFICILVLESVGIDNPFFACMTAIQTMQTDIHTSIEAGAYRLFGTAFGSIMGTIFAVIAYKYLPMDILIVQALVIPSGIMLIIYILKSFKLKDSILISCVVFLSIMINIDDTATRVSYAVGRGFSTMFGAAVALLVNRFVCPYKVKENSCEKNEN